jgi:hypothetical protein
MSATLRPGPVKWSLTRLEDNNREYKITHRVNCDRGDGPFTALNASGLPRVGDAWNFDNDSDPAAVCWPNAVITPVIDDGEPTTQFLVEQTFSTKPIDFFAFDPLDDPLLEPPVVTGSFTRVVEEATIDRFKNQIVSSSFEQIRGYGAEFDNGTHTVHIEHNVPNLQLLLCTGLLHSVNNATMWGMPKRCVKMSTFNWQALYKNSGTKYYRRIYDFDINAKTFDKEVPDEGYKVLRGYFMKDGRYRVLNIDGAFPDRNNPAHFRRAQDDAGNLFGKVILDGEGLPANVIIVYDPTTAPDTGTGTTHFADPRTPANIRIEKYTEADLFQLGIPTEL